MPIRKLIDFLDDNKVKYVSISHSPAYTAQETAQTVHLPGRQLAKCVMLKLKGELVMMIIPANHKVNIAALQKTFNTDDIILADENEFRDKFPHCEAGAMPPFGHLYNMKAYLCDRFNHQESIVFNAGSHSLLIQMPFDAYVKLAKPKLVDLGNT